MRKFMTGAQIRQSFIDFFIARGHTFVPSSSLVPGGDQTLLFTNAGMVQFKDVFLGTDHRPYKRAVNSQKCMRVAGKHNDLDDVGRDDSHHTFFEMLGNWSFGDYYKKEAIAWAWELLTEEWGLEKSKLWATCFQDDQGSIPTDEEAAFEWRNQPGMNPEHILFFGRKENFWEMAEIGPCGPCSEIHIDLGPESCNKQGVPGHICKVNGDCDRFLELWNNVFIQYNRLGLDKLELLPATHVDTGMGFERIVRVIQGVRSNYQTDLLTPMMDMVQQLTGHSDEQKMANITPYRVIADHSRAASFLIGDGVVPGNTGRNYVCRMIIRRAARFGTKIGLNEPFLARIAEEVIEEYGSFYPELIKNRNAILDSILREEKRFQRTVEAGLGFLDDLLSEVKNSEKKVLNGQKAFDLYATHGLPFELTRDIAQEQGMDVDAQGFRKAMEEHRLVSGAGKAFGPLGGEDVEVYRGILDELIAKKEISIQGVQYDPYSTFEVQGKVLAMVGDGDPVLQAREGDMVEVLLPATCFYVESGGQVSDKGTIVSMAEPRWEIQVDEMRKPAAGIIVHVGTVIRGRPAVGDQVIATVDIRRRQDIMRNHTATHLLHAELHAVLGDHARQAGSLVAPDRLRFDFTHSEAISDDQLEQIEQGVNLAILENFRLNIAYKPLSQAIAEGATALFGEKYGETVRTITIGSTEPISYELCGGTHVGETGDIGMFLITSEGSAAAGVRRIEAVTGRGAYELVQNRFRTLKRNAKLLNSSIDEAPYKLQVLLDELGQSTKEVLRLRMELAGTEFSQQLDQVVWVGETAILAVILPSADLETLRQMTDRFRRRYSSGVVAVGSVINDRPAIIVAITDDLVKRGLNSGEIVKSISRFIDGSGGGRPTLAQAGGKDATRLPDAINAVLPFIKNKLNVN